VRDQDRLKCHTRYHRGQPEAALIRAAIERHFRSMRPLWGEAFTLLPADQG
jgi:hypothetical protein